MTDRAKALAKVVMALRFYGDSRNYRPDPDAIVLDGGETARIALDAIKRAKLAETADLQVMITSAGE